MGTQYFCKSLGRRNAVRELKTLNGIDYLEVASEDQKTLKVFFIHPLPGQADAIPPSPAPPLTEKNFRIEGGVRVKNIHVLSVGPVNNPLTLTVNEAGDFSTYTLRLVTSPTHPETPSGFDPQLSAVEFSFKAACPSEFDCQTVTECPPPRLTQPEINYLAKDYASFRRLMLDRLSVIMPDWRERNPADAQIALVELLAYVGDHLSYYQDAVATEAYLGTARRRISVRRHARLLDYFVHDGCTARAWVCVEVTKGGDAEGKKLPAGSALLTRGSDGKTVVALADLERALAEQPIVFETMHDVTLHSAHNEMSFYTWNDSECCLPRGATRATLLNEPPLSLKAGEVLVLEEVLSPTTGLKADADPTHRQAVRLKQAVATTDRLNNTNVMEIEWHEADALPFPLCLTALVETTSGIPEVKVISVTRGNVVLADHGFTRANQSLIPPVVSDQGVYRPRLRHDDISFAVPYDHDAARLQAAASAVVQDPRRALPLVSLNDGDEDWTAQRDLLGSDRFAAEFVVEVERDGSADLRFGDDVLGKRPSASATFKAKYRVGNGRAGNIGAETISRIVSTFTGIESVRNPLAATGGTDGETMEEVRQYAPQAFRTQQRAVTEADYAEVAQRHPEVQKAAATFRWTGSWYTVFVTIDRQGGKPVKEDEKFKEDLRAHLERYRIAGYDLEIADPVFVPLEILLLVCVKPGYFRSDVKEALLKVFSQHELASGQRGFFHPDNFTFGQPVYLSQIYQVAMGVDGVASVEAKTFQRWGRKPDGELKKGVLKPAALEIIRLDNDPNFPENGKIAFDVQGGL